MFVLLTYGGRIGLNFGYSLPCFSCPFVHGCAGYCFLMALQGIGPWGFGYFAQLLTYRGFQLVLWFFVFIILAILLSKLWCGWICPFGTLQDWLTQLRKKLGIREMEFSWKTRDRLKPIKYVLLSYLIIIPLLIAFAGLHSDFTLPFCQICPARPIMPLFVGQTRYFALDFTNTITLVFSVLSITIAAGTLIGCFFKDRFFCIFCPMLPLLQMFKKISFIRFEKSVHTCSGCGNCQRMCPMDIRDVHLEKVKQEVMSEDCLLCMKCIESCPEDSTLSTKFLNRNLFSSSRKYVAENYSKGSH
ncbi:MAG: 4Fe-4S binding protein [Veillonellales bacterium]